MYDKKAWKKASKKGASIPTKTLGWFIKIIGSSVAGDMRTTSCIPEAHKAIDEFEVKANTLGNKFISTANDISNPLLENCSFINSAATAFAWNFGDYHNGAKKILNILKATDGGKDFFFSFVGNTNLNDIKTLYEEYNKIGGINAIKDLIEKKNFKAIEDIINNCPNDIKRILNDIYSSFKTTNLDEITIEFIASIIDGYITKNPESLTKLCSENNIDISTFCKNLSTKELVQNYDLKAIWKEYYNKNQTLNDVKQDTLSIKESYNLNNDTLRKIKELLKTRDLATIFNSINPKTKFELISDSNFLIDRYFTNAEYSIFAKRRIASSICETICEYKRLPITKELMLYALNFNNIIKEGNSNTFNHLKNTNTPTLKFKESSSIATTINKDKSLKETITKALKNNNNNVNQVIHGSFSSSENPDLFGAIHNYTVIDGKIDNQGYFTGYLRDVYDFKTEKIQNDNGDINLWNLINNYAVGFQEAEILKEYELLVPIKIKL